MVQVMTKVVILTTSADADGVHHAGQEVDVPADEALELIEGGFARAVEAEERAVAAPPENAGGRRGRSRAVSGPSEAE